MRYERNIPACATSPAESDVFRIFAIQKEDDMTPRELLTKVQHLVEVAGVDPDKEIFVSAEGHSVKIAKIDWLWENPVEEDDYTKLLDIQVEVK